MQTVVFRYKHTMKVAVCVLTHNYLWSVSPYFWVHVLSIMTKVSKYWLFVVSHIIYWRSLSSIVGQCWAADSFPECHSVVVTELSVVTCNSNDSPLSWLWVCIFSFFLFVIVNWHLYKALNITRRLVFTQLVVPLLAYVSSSFCYWIWADLIVYFSTQMW
jgi:hypothetical protein